MDILPPYSVVEWYAIMVASISIIGILALLMNGPKHGKH